MSSVGAREKILAATRKILEEGRTDVGLEDVARSAGVSRQAVYLHFGSRTKLLLALVEAMDAAGLPARIAKVVAAPNGVAALDEMVEVCAQYTGEIVGVANALDAARRSDAAAAAAWNDRMAVRRRGFGGGIARLSAEGALARHLTPDEATDLAFALLSIRVWEDLVVVRGWFLKRYPRPLN